MLLDIKPISRHKQNSTRFLKQMQPSDWLSFHTLSAIGVQWLQVCEIATFSLFSRTFRRRFSEQMDNVSWHVECSTAFGSISFVFLYFICYLRTSKKKCQYYERHLVSNLVSHDRFLFCLQRSGISANMWNDGAKPKVKNYRTLSIQTTIPKISKREQMIWKFSENPEIYF